MTSPKTPSGLDPTVTTREAVFTVEVDGVTPFLKLATASRNGEDSHTFASDEARIWAASARRRRRWRTR